MGTGKMSENGGIPTSIVGIVADVRRSGEGAHVCSRCSVFGINEEEYNCISTICEIRPKTFTEEADRYMVPIR